MQMYPTPLIYHIFISTSLFYEHITPYTHTRMSNTYVLTRPINYSKGLIGIERIVHRLDSTSTDGKKKKGENGWPSEKDNISQARTAG